MRSPLLFAALALGISAHAPGAVLQEVREIGLWDAEGGSQLSVAPGSPFVTTQPAQANVSSGTGIAGGDSFRINASVDGFEFVEFRLTNTHSDQTMPIVRIAFDARTSIVDEVCLALDFYDPNAGGNYLEIDDGICIGSDWEALVFDISPNSLFDVGAGDEFGIRLRHYANSAQNIDFDNVSISALTVIPEPSSALLAAIYGLFFFARRRR